VGDSRKGGGGGWGAFEVFRSCDPRNGGANYPERAGSSTKEKKKKKKPPQKEEKQRGEVKRRGNSDKDPMRVSSRCRCSGSRSKKMANVSPWDEGVGEVGGEGKGGERHRNRDGRSLI